MVGVRARLAEAHWRRHSRRIAVGALVVLAHLAVYRALTPGAGVPRSFPAESPLEVMILPRARRKPAPGPAPRTRRRPGYTGKRRFRLAAPAPSVRPIRLPQRVRATPRSRIDWEAQIQREVLGRQLRSEAPPAKVTFGFPKMPSKAAPPPAFAWDYAATHRIELLRGEGMLININDRCSILFAGFLLPFCRIGRIAVNGELFRHTHPPDRDTLGALP